MVARALAFADVADTGQRPVSVRARLALDLVAVGGRFIQTKGGRIDGIIETHSDMALGTEVVDFVGVNFVENG